MNKLIIDIGSNSIKSLMTCDGEIVNKLKTDIALYNMINGHSSNDYIISHILLVIDDIIKSNAKYNISNIIVYATEAMRNFEASDKFTLKLKEKIGIDLQILTPEQEANFSYEVVSKNFPDFDNLLVVDMGGASTEVSLGLKRQFIDGISLSVGTSNTSKIGLSKLQSNQMLQKITDIVCSLCQRPLPVLTGGTVECLYRLDLIETDEDYDYLDLQNFKNKFLSIKDDLPEYRQNTTSNAVAILDYILGDLLVLTNDMGRIYVCKEDLRFYFI